MWLPCGIIFKSKVSHLGFRDGMGAREPLETQRKTVVFLCAYVHEYYSGEESLKFLSD